MGWWRGTSSPFPAGRSRGVTVAVDGFFAFVWFGWGQAAAPSWLVIPLAVGTALGALLAVTGVMVAKRSPGPLPAMTDPAVRRRYSRHCWPGVRPARRRCSRAGGHRALPVGTGVDLPGRRGAFLSARRNAAKPDLAPARGAACRRRRGGPGGRAGIGDGTIDGHWSGCRAMPSRLRARHSPDPRSQAQQSRHVISTARAFRWKPPAPPAMGRPFVTAFEHDLLELRRPADEQPPGRRRCTTTLLRRAPAFISASSGVGWRCSATRSPPRSTSGRPWWRPTDRPRRPHPPDEAGAGGALAGPDLPGAPPSIFP